MNPKGKNSITTNHRENLFNQLNFPKKDYMPVIIAWAVVIYFLSGIFLLTNYSYFVLSVFQFIQLFCFFLALTFLVPIRIYRKKLKMSYYEYIFLNFLGFSPIMLLFALGINYSFKSDAYLETYRIINFSSSKGSMIYILEDNKYDEYENVRTIKLSEDIEIDGNAFMAISFSDGVLGIRMIEKQKVY